MVEPTPQSYQMPLYCPPVDFGVVPIETANSHSTTPSFSHNPSGIPISPLPHLNQHSFLFHQDLITWNISLAQTQNYVQWGIIQAAPWPNTEFPKTVLYWLPKNSMGCKELDFNASLVLNIIRQQKTNGQHFINYQSLVNFLRAQEIENIEFAVRDYIKSPPKPNREHLTTLVAGMIYARTNGSLEEITHIGFNLIKPPIYHESTNELARAFLRQSRTLQDRINEAKRKQQAETDALLKELERYKAGSSITG